MKLEKEKTEQKVRRGIMEKWESMIAPIKIIRRASTIIMLLDMIKNVHNTQIFDIMADHPCGFLFTSILDKGISKLI